MRRLIENRAAAFRCVELFRTARAVQIVGVVQRIDHAHLAERAALDELAQMLHGRIERVAVPDDHMHAGTPSRVDDDRAIFDASAPSVFRSAGACRLRPPASHARDGIDAVLRYRPRRRPDRRRAPRLCHRRLRKIPRRTACGPPCGCRRPQRAAPRVAGKCRQHHRKRAAKSGDAETERSCISHRQGPALSLVLS